MVSNCSLKVQNSVIESGGYRAQGWCGFWGNFQIRFSGQDCAIFDRIVEAITDLRREPRRCLKGGKTWDVDRAEGDCKG